MASPTVSPASGTIREKVTRERVIPAEKSGSAPEFWEYIESLSPEMWQDHIVYLYREDPKASTYAGAGGAYLDKFAGYIEVRPGVQIPMEDRGIIEAAIKEKFGGRAFRLICKKGRERITEGKCVNEAPPKYPDTNPQPAFAGPLPHGSVTDSNAVAAKAIDVMASQEPNAMRLAMEIMQQSAQLLRTNMSVPTAPPASSLDEELKRVMIQRMLHPDDGLERFARLKELFTPPQNSTVDKILTIAVERMMAPPAVAGKSTLLDLGREVIPHVAQTVTTAVHEWRLGMEAQRDGMAMAAGQGRTVNVTPAPNPPQPLPPAPVAAAAPAAEVQPNPPAPQNAGVPSIDWIASKIAQIVRDLDYTVDEAVDEVLSFLYLVDPAIVASLLNPPSIHPALKPGEEGLLMLFQNHEQLKVVPVNPRLTEFIKKFFAAATESESQRLMKPQAPPTPQKPA